MAIPGIILGVVVLLVLAPVAAAVVYRLVVVRRNATSVLVRRAGEESWRHGAVRYSDTDLAFYRLVSVRFGADVRLDRRSLELGPRRQPTGHELDIAESGEVIVSFSGHDRRRGIREGELCVGPAELTALLAWVEACSTDQIRSPDRRRR
ncbi:MULTISPECIES: DUF2550 family protein [unclassified Dietzia]|uniref:DUF2550 family protein n=1 Tax=unclassified Dietzia TaxID=2617939 RepID=UPI000D22717B|nr:MULTISPECIES: DUF2550 family protein [unclassified Dietzia]AVZ39687.1 DUF2550 domain-containing protein [Dietzia sp. JS16-p6b]MBB1023383.1 DUF2550 family protein [Dietzia sp. DQ12-76]MBB1026623.1 DUF2550 family protein [Dietzia sp. DQ11-38-2]QGW25007.1 hypothetical protein GJR88_03059 [Dietzia sp. DQ12-45-1b]